MAENADRLSELLADQEFLKKVFSQETPEKAQAILNENGVDMDVKDVYIMGKALLYMGEHDGELPDELTEQVAGGFDLLGIAKQLGALPYAVQGVVSMIGGIGVFLEAWNKPEIGEKAMNEYFKLPSWAEDKTTENTKTTK